MTREKNDRADSLAAISRSREVSLEGEAVDVAGVVDNVESSDGSHTLGSATNLTVNSSMWPS